MTSPLGRLAGAWRKWGARREAAAVARRPIPDDVWKRTLARHPFLRRRDPTDEAQLRRLTSLFLDRKEFHVVGGLRLTDDLAVAIAAQACLPVLRLGVQRYDGFVGIVVHPDAVAAPRSVTDDDGVVHEYTAELAGEAVEGGPLMLSWRDVRGPGPAGYNVVVHEFAHVLDLADGIADGVPLLPPELPRSQWVDTLTRSWEDFAARVERGEETVLDCYAATAPDEFFAVASEAFFTMPETLRAGYPDFHALLRRLYLQDPAAETAPPRSHRRRPATGHADRS